VDLYRTILTHAAEGVLGEWGEKAAMGRILRYRLRVAGPTTLELYGSKNTASLSGPVTFNELFDDYSNPNTRANLNPFGDYTYLDARLILKPKTRREADNFVNALDKQEESVIFTWIAADKTAEVIIKDIIDIQNPEALAKYLKENVPQNYWEKEPGWAVLKDRYDIHTLKSKRFEGGVQLLAVTSGQVNDDETHTLTRRVCVDVKPDDDGQKFNLNKWNDSHEISKLYESDYLIAVASFRDSGGSATRPPMAAYVKLGKRIREADFFRDMVAALDDPSPIDPTGRTFKNPGGGGITTYEDSQTKRRFFRAKAPTLSRTDLILLKFAPGDFAHMIPEDAETAEEIFYGPTNYAVYIDSGSSSLSTSSGFGFLLNGSTVYNIGGVHRSGGYIFQYDPGANGLCLMYYGYNGGTYAWLNISGAQYWGVRSMYFYDAVNESFSAPKNIFFSAPGEEEPREENFSVNAGAGPDVGLKYRLPLSAGSNAYPNSVASFSESREVFANDPYSSQSNGSQRLAVYSPKHMQSWHASFDETGNTSTQIFDMLDTNNKDARIGFRWDRSWHIPNTDIWKLRQILKLTILEVTKDIAASDIEPEWQGNIHHTGGSGAASTVHQEGDLFVRAELIHLKNGETDWNDSRNYVYSKPVWYGKFKGDAWRGDDPSPFKKMGNSMQHLVADPEPRDGNAQSFRRRGMRVRSWKEAFKGWNFSKVEEDETGNYHYVWWDFVNSNDVVYDKNNPFGNAGADTGPEKMPPDFYEAADSVWTPPIAIDLNGGAVAQTSGFNTADGFGQYKYNQSVGGAMRDDGVMVYSGDYGDQIYGRLSYLRKWGDATPLFGLYAVRGWDLGTSRRNSYVYDSTGNTSKRFLSVFQGMRFPYKPGGASPDREPTQSGQTAHSKYTAKRDRIIGFRFWGAEMNIYDSWIGEGFSPREVRAILGLRGKNLDESDEEYLQFIRGTYVHANPGKLDLEDANFYVPTDEEN
jgi:hypothetical protein